MIKLLVFFVFNLTLCFGACKDFGSNRTVCLELCSCFWCNSTCLSSISDSSYGPGDCISNHTETCDQPVELNPLLWLGVIFGCICCIIICQAICGAGYAITVRNRK